jgi:hypothetical protein
MKEKSGKLKKTPDSGLWIAKEHKKVKKLQPYPLYRLKPQLNQVSWTLQDDSLRLKKMIATVLTEKSNSSQSE